MKRPTLVAARARLLLAGAAAAVLAFAVWLWVALHDETVGGGAIRLDLAQSLAVGPHYPINAAGAEGDWRHTPLPDNWSGRRTGYAGYVWYRFELPVDTQRHIRPAMYLPVVNMNAEVWIDGRRLAAEGRMTPQLTRHFYTPWIVDLPPSMLRQDGTATRVEVLLVGHQGFRCGLAPIWVGEYEPLYAAFRWRYFWQKTGTDITIVLSIAMGLYALLVWWRERSHTAFAWFGAAAMVWDCAT